MELKQLIIKCFFIIFGIIEVVTNGFYLSGEKRIMKAKLQHREIPENVTKSKLKIKVTIMFLFGWLFLLAGILSFSKNLLYILILFNIYLLCEAMHYKYWKTFGAFFVSLIMTVIYVICR